MSTGIEWDDLIKNSSTAFDPLPEGDYDVTVVESSAATTQTGKDMVKLKMRVDSGPHANRHVFNQHVLSTDNPNALSFWFQHMAAYGLTKDWFATTKPSIERIAAEIGGKRVRVTLDTRDWNGQKRNNVKSIKPAVGPPPVGGVPSPAPSGGPGTSPAPAPTPTPTGQPAPAPAPLSAAPPPPAPTDDAF